MRTAIKNNVTSEFSSFVAFKPRTETKSKDFELWINGELRGCYETQDLAELRAHEMQTDGLVVETLAVKHVEGRIYALDKRGPKSEH
jgi:hypothetical protein